MNRNNFWIHFCLAIVLITFAAVLGQLDRWRAGLKIQDTTPITKTELSTSDVNSRNTARSPELLVRFKPGVSLERVRSVALSKNDMLVDEFESVSGLTVIDDMDDADIELAVREYSGMSDLVEYAEPNFAIKLDDPIQKDSRRDLLYREAETNVPDDPQFEEQWALNNLGQDGGTKRADLDALKAWEKTTGSEDVVVAVLDSGVDYNHEDLRNNMWTRPANLPAYVDDELGPINDENGYDADAIGDPMDDNGHGTHCAGIIGAEGNNGIGVAGINWKVRIMPLKFLGRGGFGTTQDAIEAINYAIDRKKKGVNLRVISASWGSNNYSRALQDTIRAAGDAGILFVAAAGNDSSSNDRRPHYPSNYDLPNVISVAALDRNDRLASFSNYGVTSVHVAAPGKEILSTWLNGSYREASGTSMATPYVSGVAALIVAAEPRIGVAELKRKLLSSADKLETLNGKVATAGRICAANALSGAKANHLPH
jgi:thermitase